MTSGPGLSLALVQMNTGDDIGRNLEVADQYLRAASARGAELAILPENFALMGASENLRRDAAEPDGDGPLQSALSDMARRHGLWLVGGTIPVIDPADDRPAAACLVYDSAGIRQGRYDKLHLFDVSVPDATERYRESANTAPGRTLLSLPTPWGRLGVAVCYDLRFPELFGRMAQDGAELVAVPAAFTRPTGAAHWELLIRARALDMLAFIAAAAQTGEHPGGRRTWGHSMVAGPWGNVVHCAGESPGVQLIELDMGLPARLRSEFPVLQHKRMRASLPAEE